MKKTKQLFGLTALLFFLFSLVLLSCEKETEEDKAPELPPQDAFVMNFDDFKNNSKSFSTQQLEKETETIKNWSFAVLNVGVWNTLISVGLAVPVLSYKEAFNHKAVRTGVGQWEWKYNFTAAAVKHTATLKARINNEQIIWMMYISKEGFYNDFLWFDGVSNISGQNGTWILYNNPTAATKLLGIEWNKNTTTGIANIKYVNIVPYGPENGGYIAYGTSNENFDAYYDIYNKGKDQLVNIKWNRTTKAGSVKAPHFFINSDWNCWDTTLADTDCN